jgi:hypothetical protein
MVAGIGWKKIDLVRNSYRLVFPNGRFDDRRSLFQAGVCRSNAF